MTRTRTIAATTVVGLTFLATACGGGGSGAATKTTQTGASVTTTAGQGSTGTTQVTTTTAPGARALDLSPNERFAFGGVAYTLQSITSAPNPDDPASSRLKVGLLAKVNAIRSGQQPTMKFLVKGLDVPLLRDPTDLNTTLAPGANRKVTYVGPIDNADLAAVGVARLVVGEESDNQAVVPVGPGSAQSAVRHPMIEQTEGQTQTATDQRAGQVTVVLQKTFYGASNRTGVPAPKDSISVGASLRVCVSRLDQAYAVTLTDPTGITTESHTAIDETRPGSAGPGAIVNATCPATQVIEVWTHLPVAAEGKPIRITVTGGFGSEPDVVHFDVSVPKITETTVPS